MSDDPEELAAWLSDVSNDPVRFVAKLLSGVPESLQILRGQSLGSFGSSNKFVMD